MGDPNLTASMAGIDAKIEKLKEKKKKIQLRASERFVRAAIKAGLLDVEVDEMDLLKAFRDVAERFRRPATKSTSADTHKARSAHKVLMGRRWAMTNDDRRKDAREKIALGGLIVKAGLRGADKAFLLGILMEAATHTPGSNEHTRLEKLGKTAFGEAQEKTA